MSNVVQAVADTRGALGPDVPVDHIDDQLVEEYETSLREGEAELVGAPSETDSSVEARTKVLFGNHYALLGKDFMFKSNGAGQPCGSGFVLHATGWESAKAEQVESCPGHFPGYRFTFSYRK